MTENIKYIIESLLFVSETPLSIERIKSVLATEDTKSVRSALKELIDEYERRGGGFYLKEVANGFQIRTRPEYTDWIKRLIQPNPPRLSKAALETLAIIAYKQPVIRSDIEHIRGVDSGGVLRLLLERKFVRILGRKEIPGRPLIYATTKEFLQVFDLRDLKDLPTLKEIDAFGNPAAEDSTHRGSEETATPDEKPEVTGGEPENSNGKKP
jgi:segregation and condensation protein B